MNIPMIVLNLPIKMSHAGMCMRMNIYFYTCTHARPMYPHRVRIIHVRVHSHEYVHVHIYIHIYVYVYIPTRSRQTLIKTQDWEGQRGNVGLRWLNMHVHMHIYIHTHTNRCTYKYGYNMYM
jgi:hypothetical protein